MIYNKSCEVATLDGWKPLSAIEEGDLVMGMGHDRRPINYPGTRKMELAVPILKKHIVPFEGHAVKLWRRRDADAETNTNEHEILAHPMTEYPSVSKSQKSPQLLEQHFKDFCGVSRNFSMVCANYEPPQHADYTRLPREVPLSEIIRVKAHYLERGLWTYYTPDSIRHAQSHKPEMSWYAIGKEAFETILSTFLGESVRELRSRQKIQIRDTIRNSDLMEYLQLLCCYYGYHASVEWQPRTVILKIAARNVLRLQQRMEFRQIADWEYLEGQTFVLVSRLRYYLLRIEGEPFFVGLTRENAERGSVIER